jgi:hypothetical protein
MAGGNLGSDGAFPSARLLAARHDRTRKSFCVPLGGARRLRCGEDGRRTASCSAPQPVPVQSAGRVHLFGNAVLDNAGYLQGSGLMWRSSSVSACRLLSGLSSRRKTVLSRCGPVHLEAQEELGCDANFLCKTGLSRRVTDDRTFDLSSLSGGERTTYTECTCLETG